MPTRVRDRFSLLSIAGAVPYLAATLTMVGSGLVLVGWHYRISALKALPGSTPMSPNSALCLLVGVVGLLLLLPHYAGRARRLAGRLCGVGLVGFGSVTLAEYVAGVERGLSQLFFEHRLHDWNLPSVPGRIAPTTALAFILLGGALLALDLKRNRRLSENLALLVMFVATSTMVGYAYGVSAVSLLESYAWMALNTAMLLFVMAAGVMFARPTKGIAGLLASPDPAGILSRRLLLASAAVLLLLGWGAIWAVRSRAVSPDFVVTVMAVLFYVVLGVLTVRTARVVRQYERTRKRAEETLRTTEKLAVTGQLAAALAHEVNNPLAAVTNLLYLLHAHPALDDRARGFVETAQAELGRITHVTRQTLSFYRESNTAVSVQLSEVLDDVLGLYQRALSESQIEVRREFKYVPEIEGYPGELRQIFANLVGNAIDAVGRGGTIVIRLFPSRDWHDHRTRLARVVIADSGCGISSLNLGRVFEPFFTTKGQKGTGLGLWVTHGLVSKHAGAIRVRTSVGHRRGTTFVLAFPFELQGERKPAASVGRAATERSA